MPEALSLVNKGFFQAPPFRWGVVDSPLPFYTDHCTPLFQSVNVYEIPRVSSPLPHQGGKSSSMCTEVQGFTHHLLQYLHSCVLNSKVLGDFYVYQIPKVLGKIFFHPVFIGIPYTFPSPGILSWNSVHAFLAKSTRISGVMYTPDWNYVHNQPYNSL